MDLIHKEAINSLDFIIDDMLQDYYDSDWNYERYKEFKIELIANCYLLGIMLDGTVKESTK